MATPLEGTERAADKLKRVRYTHDAMIDLMLANPTISQNELALQFNMSVPWISSVVNSDAFKRRMAERKTELVDPIIAKELNEKIESLAHLSLGVIQKKLVATEDKDLAVKTAELTIKALGFGARPEKNPTVQNTFVVALPNQAPSAQAWEAAMKEQFIDVPAKEIPNV